MREVETLGELEGDLVGMREGELGELEGLDVGEIVGATVSGMEIRGKMNSFRKYGKVRNQKELKNKTAKE